MYSGLVGQNTPIIDILTVLTGTWDERHDHDWHVVMCPFFVSMDRTVEAGSVALPFKVTVPTAALLYGASGTAHAIVVKPTDDAIVCPEAGYVQINIFGSTSQLKAVR
jgi:hypothetical protein